MNDFLQWLELNDLMLRYWRVVDYACHESGITTLSFIGQMDANNPDALFRTMIDSGFLFFEKVKLDYASWLEEFR